MALGPVTLGGATGAPVAMRQFGPTFRLRSIPNAGPAPALTESRGTAAARVQVHSTEGQLSIDTTAGRESMGYFNMLGMLHEIVRITDQARARGIAEIVNKGDMFAKPYMSDNMIAQLAKQSMLEDYRTHQYELAFVPKTPPSINYTPGTVTIDVVY